MKRALAFVIALSIAASAFADDAKFRLGISAPLSGVLSEYGTAVRNGIALAQAQNPDLLGRIEIVFEDSQWDPKTAVAAFRALTEVKRVDLVYNWGNPTSEAVAPIAERARIPTLAMSSDPKIALGKTFLIRSIPSSRALGELLGTHLFARGFRNLGVVIAENSYVQGLYDGLEKLFRSKGGTVTTIEQCALTQQDFRSIITKAKGASYDAIGVFLISGQVSTFYRQLANLGAQKPSFGADFLGSKTEVLAAGPAIEGAVYPDLGVTETFREQYRKAYGNDIEIAFAANAHDVATIVAQEFGQRTSAPLSPEQIITKLRHASLIDGAHRRFEFREDQTDGPRFDTPLVMRRVKGGEIVDE